eukprot:g15923.t1
MSDPRSTYPKATAWTFLLDTPAEAGAGGASGTKAPAPATAAGGAGRPRLTAAGGAAKAAAKRKSSLTSSSSHNGNEEMGSACSKPNVGVADKENMAELETEMLVPNGGDATSNGHRAKEDDAECNSGGPGADSEPLRASKEAAINERAVLGGAALDSTAFLSPEPEKEQEEEGPAAAVDSPLVAVENGIARLRGGGGHVGSAGEGRMRYEDKPAWIARNLEMLPTRGAGVEVDQLNKLPGLENCLLELLEERGRHLTAMDNLTGQLRRREAESTKASHDIKALTARLECLEQDKSALDRRARAAGEEQRVERARWFVHKQELETRCVQLESRDTQYRASIRKKEVEYGRLQDSLRRAVDKGSSSSSTMMARGAGGKGSAKGRGIETNLELSPGEATTEGGRNPLGGVLNEKAMCRVEELEAENSGLRSMLVDLQGEVMELKGYHDRHGDLVSAGRASVEGGIWGGRMSVEPLPDDVIEGMPADWLERQLGEETARQIKGMRGALKRVLGDDDEGATGEDSMSQEDLTCLMSQLREARSLLREQDAIMFAAIFDRPGASDANRKRCVCGVDADGLGGSGVWDSLERLEQEREELERERSKLEKDKAKFLEEAVKRDSKSFVYSGPAALMPETPAAARDNRYATPTHSNRQGAGEHGRLSVATTSPMPGRGEATGAADGASLPLMTFTPPGASPDTQKLLGQLGIDL